MIWLRPTTAPAHADDLRPASIPAAPPPRRSWLARALRWSWRVVLKYMGRP